MVFQTLIFTWWYLCRPTNQLLVRKKINLDKQYNNSFLGNSTAVICKGHKLRIAPWPSLLERPHLHLDFYMLSWTTQYIEYNEDFIGVKLTFIVLNSILNNSTFWTRSTSHKILKIKNFLFNLLSESFIEVRTFIDVLFVTTYYISY